MARPPTRTRPESRAAAAAGPGIAPAHSAPPTTSRTCHRQQVGQRHDAATRAPSRRVRANPASATARTGAVASRPNPWSKNSPPSPSGRNAKRAVDASAVRRRRVGRAVDDDEEDHPRDRAHRRRTARNAIALPRVRDPRQAHEDQAAERRREHRKPRVHPGQQRQRERRARTTATRSPSVTAACS